MSCHLSTCASFIKGWPIGGSGKVCGDKILFLDIAKIGDRFKNMRLIRLADLANLANLANLPKLARLAKIAR